MSLEALWAVLLLPLIGAAVNGMVGQKRGRTFTNLFGVGSIWLAFLLALLLAVSHHSGATPNHYPDTQAPFYWFDAGILKLKLGLLLDPLSIVMMLIVTGVGALIHTYSMGYMADDPGYNRYFAYLNLFTFSMLVLVLADSFLLMFVGWELVGLCSYLLIGFWYDRQSATDAGKKAFIVNRVGDWAFIIGVILTFVVFVPRAQGNQGLMFQPVFQDLATHVRDSAHLTGNLGLIPVIALLLFIGATGKSAQLPVLHVWLPDAMEGPTPVSALIHAATMVTAGVYMVARCHDFFLLSPDVMRMVAWIGAITAFVAATTAIVQTDIKKVLAYSTISQIGFMFIGAGVGAFTYSIFHLMTHAFFKALLFLGAGAVIHALHNEQDMRKMGGLRRHLPQISILMGVGVLAIAGVPPFAGFWSKDLILGQAAAFSPWLW
nr:NADH-quinone oxidoreductase subunit L [Armatimonadota bacterium]